MNQVVQYSAKDFFARPIVKQKMEELLGKNAPAFITSVLQIVNSNSMLVNADPQTIFSASCMSATLNLPINNNLGFAYIVPFKNNKTGKVEAQFQLGYKGFIQLAQRSGQFKRINACAVYDGDDDDSIHNRLTAMFPKVPPSKKVVGYIAYFELLNGYQDHLTMSIDEINAHAQKYSQTAKKGFGVWKDHFDTMAQKTVLKLLLSKKAPLSIEMQTAVQADQAIIRDVEKQEFDYLDNQDVIETVKPSVPDADMPMLIEQIKAGALDAESVIHSYDFTSEQLAKIKAELGA